MADLHALLDQGQSAWLDFIQRDLVRSGELARMVDDGLRGLTSNPSIFEKAISKGAEYDDDLRARLKAEPRIASEALYESLAIRDIRDAADVFASVYRDSRGDDGYVSLEVSPRLAHDTPGTLADARRLWRAVDRPNLMIKVPATPAGIPAIEQLLSEGINVNVTLIFGLSHYEAVAQAYLRGVAKAKEPHKLASVASVFVSRVDGAVDPKLDALGSPAARALRGKVAVANSKLCYARFQEIFHGAPFAALAKKGVRAQRVLYGSTSTKDKAYSDVKYVEELIGPETVNTIPPDALKAFLDHGRAQPTLTSDVAAARAVLADLAKLGISLDAVTEHLQADGVAKFIQSFDDLLASLEAKRGELVA